MNWLYTIYSFCIALPIFVVLTILTAVSVIVASLLGDTDFVCYHTTRWWSRLTLWVFLLPIRVEGRELIDKKQSYVFLANHQGYLDIFLVYAYLGHNFKWMMKEYLRKIPFVGFACQRSKQIFVGEGLASIHKTVVEAQQTLRNGMSMVIFPEGTRTHDGTLSPFKKGAFTLASEIGLPIVPITINGSFRAFSRQAKRVTRTPLTLTIHEPLTVEYRKGKPTRVVMQEVWDIIHADLDTSFQ